MHHRKTVSMSKGLQAQLGWTQVLPALLHQATSKAYPCEPTLENGKLERSLVSITKALSLPCISSHSVILKEAMNKGMRKRELPELGKGTYSYASLHPHFVALLYLRGHSPPLYLPPTPFRSSCHLFPIILASLFS